MWKFPCPPPSDVRDAWMSEMTVLIGLMGCIGAGKTTAAEILSCNFGLTEYAMADPIKRIAMVLGFTRSEVYGTQDEKRAPSMRWGVSARSFLQRFGTDVCGTYLPTLLPELANVWIRLFEHFLADHPAVVVSDVRFLDEAEMIRRHGGILIHIVRELETIDTHRSETEQGHITAEYTLLNNGTLSDLETRLCAIVCEHLQLVNL